VLNFALVLIITKRLLAILALTLLGAALVSVADASTRPTVIFDGKATEVASPNALGQSQLPKTSDNLWVAFEDLTRATGFEVKPQGVCRAELCFPLPAARRSDFITRLGSKTAQQQWFNLTAFARLLHQPVAHDVALNIWYFGPRPEVQNNFLASFQAPNFTLPDMDGKPHSLSDFRGKKVLIVTWASW
jgi:hypothetical protein